MSIHKLSFLKGFWGKIWGKGRKRPIHNFPLLKKPIREGDKTVRKAEIGMMGLEKENPCFEVRTDLALEQRESFPGDGGRGVGGIAAGVA